MSGVEVVGFVLGAIPLVISAVEHYKDCLDPFIDYSHYQSTLKALRTRLRIQLNLYEGTLKRLLLSELSSVEADILFPGPNVPVEAALWGTLELEAKLQKKLGKQYDTFMDVIREMDAVMKRLMDKLDIDMKGKPKWMNTPSDNIGDTSGQRRARIEWEWRKIRRSFGRKEREELLQKFERYNSNIASFVSNNEIIAPQTEPRTKSFMTYFDTVRNNTLGIYETLEKSWKCPYIHSANLRLEGSGKALIAKKPSAFHVCFSSCQGQTSNMQGGEQVTWKETLITIDVMDDGPHLPEATSITQNSKSRADPKVKGVSILHPTKSSPFSKLFKLSDRKDRKDRKEVSQGKVQFVQQSPPIARPMSVRQEPKIECLCNAIRLAPPTSKCLGILSFASQDHHSSMIVTTAAPQIYAGQSYLSLDHMITPRSRASPESPRLGKLSRQQRLGLAVTLASSVLQFYNSPWLDDLWSKRDIRFFLNGTDDENRPSLSEPFIMRSFPTQRATSAVSNNIPANQFLSHLIVNKTLFALGIVLIELCLNKPLEDLRSQTSSGAEANLADDYQVAISNIDNVYAKGGSEYGYVVQRCLRCEFGVQDSKKRLDLDTFRSIVYEGVVAPLEEDYKKYSIYRGISI